MELQIKSQDFTKNGMSFILLLLVFGTMQAQTSNIIYRDGAGKLNYVSDVEDNRIPDFSFAGYKSGEAAIPTVPVVRTISPISGDNRAHIQAAIDAVSARPLVNGIRGAVLLRRGEYEVVGSVYIRHSGVVLRGEGNGSNPASNTIIFSPERNSRNSLNVIRVEGEASSGRYISTSDILSGTESAITNDFLPVNSRSFRVANAGLYAVNDIVCIYRKPENEWFQLVDGGGVVNDAPWSASTNLLMVYPRKITAINGNTVIVDQPVYEHIFGNGVTTTTLFKLNTLNDRFISNVGLENFRVTAGYTSANVNRDFNARGCVQFDGVWDSWATDVVTENFWFSGFDLRTTNRITLDRCEALDPISPITGGYRYNFNMNFGANNILVKNSKATKARHAYTSNGASFVSGIVFLNCTSEEDNAAIEGHRLWSQALLFDGLTVTNPNVAAVLGLYNRGDFGTAHGWSSAHSVVWNSSSTKRNTRFIVQKPPTAQNYAMFNNASVNNSGPFPGPRGYYQGTGQTAPFPSLYEAQLTDRLAHGVLPDAPARVAASRVNGNLSISWLDNSGEEDGYVIEISTDGGATYRTLATVAANEQQYVTPMNNATYDFNNADFQIYARKESNKSSRRKFTLATTGGGNPSQDADAYVRGGTYANTNYGTSTALEVKEANNADFDRMSFLKFNLNSVSNSNIRSAKIRLKVRRTEAGAQHTMRFVENDSWTETGITRNNMPVAGSLVSTQSVPAVNQWIEFDVTSLITQELTGDRILSVRLSESNNTLVSYHSMNATNPNDRPQIQYEFVAIRAEEDAFVRGGTYANTNYGTDTSLIAKDANNVSFDRVSFLKFDLSNIPNNVSNARVRLKVNRTEAGAQHSLHFISNDTWTESGITWNNRPATASLIGTESVPEVNRWIEFDVTSRLDQELNGDGILSVRISESNANNTNVEYYSNDVANIADRPQLLYDLIRSTSTQKSQTTEVLLVDDFEKMLEGLEIYPNPVSSTIFIESAENIKNVKIFSIDGRMIPIHKEVEVNDNTFSINVDSLVPGIYILYFEDNKGNQIQRKIIKN
ncbi:MAG: DNRLRE domain-containing protein [Flavobacteriaceae bacterium]